MCLKCNKNVRKNIIFIQSLNNLKIILVVSNKNYNISENNIFNGFLQTCNLKIKIKKICKITF